MTDTLIKPKIDYAKLFASEHMDENFLRYEDADVMAISKTYPHDDEYDISTYIEYIDFDKERELDIATGRGFIISPSKSIKKDLKDENSIYSPRFGQTLADVNPFIDRYKCRCGELRGRLNSGIRCSKCNTLCKYVDDDFSYFGWMVLNGDYMIIHPSFYKKLDSFFGQGQSIQGMKRTKLKNMLEVNDQFQDINGVKTDLNIKDEPFFGIGMIDFIKRFDEIMDYYYKKKSSNENKRILYEDIYAHRHLIFTHSIPVFTTLLRPFDIRDGSMSHEITNAMYAMMNKHVTMINKNNTYMQREPKIKNQNLFNLQTKFMELYAELENILSGKKGDFRCLLGGRYNFSARNVIVQNSELRIDEVTLPTIALTIMLEQVIKNIMHRLYNMQPTDAHSEWYKATIEPTPLVTSIIQSVIDDYKKKGMRGIPIIINRNPSLGYGSILCMTCVGMTNTYTMALPLQCLASLNADQLHHKVPFYRNIEMITP